MDILSEIRRIQLVLTFKIHEELCFENTQLLKYKEFCCCSWVCSDGAAPWLYEHKVHCLSHKTCNKREFAFWRRIPHCIFVTSKIFLLCFYRTFTIFSLLWIHFVLGLNNHIVAVVWCSFCIYFTTSARFPHHWYISLSSMFSHWLFLPSVFTG